MTLLLAACSQKAPETPEEEGVFVAVDPVTGNLTRLEAGGHNYAGGYALWRMYYNTPEQKEIEISGASCTPTVRESADTIFIDYDGLDGKAFQLHLTVWTENGEVHFGATLENNEPHTIIRELQYPLIGHLQIPEEYKLLTTHTGGQVFDDPVHKIANVDTRALYMTPAQKFRQYDLQYPRNAAATVSSGSNASAPSSRLPTRPVASIQTMSRRDVSLTVSSASARRAASRSASRKSGRRRAVRERGA